MAGKDKKDAGSGVTPVLTGESVQFQPAPPGALEALAAQLSQGYGAPQQANMDYLNNLYRPMSLPMPKQYGVEGSGGGGSGGSSGAGGMFGGILDKWFSSDEYANYLSQFGMTPPNLSDIDTSGFQQVFGNHWLFK